MRASICFSRRHTTATAKASCGWPSPGCLPIVISLPVHWESLRYPAYVSFNNTVYDPGGPMTGRCSSASLLQRRDPGVPHRWFNDYRSLANVWLPALLVMALAARPSRAGFYAAAVVLTQALLRLNTSEAGAMFDRIQHMIPLIAGPALAGFVRGSPARAGWRSRSSR